MSKVTLVFEGENACDLHKQVCEYVQETSAQTPAAPKEVARATAPAKTKKEAKEVEAKEVEAKEVEAVEEEPNPFDSDEEVTEPETELSFESITQQLKAVGEKIGVAKVRDILKSVGTTKAKDLDEKNFKKVSDACKKALA